MSVGSHIKGEKLDKEYMASLRAQLRLRVNELIKIHGIDN